MLFSSSLLAYVGSGEWERKQKRGNRVGKGFCFFSHAPPQPSGEQPALTPRRLTLYNTATRAPIQELPFADAVGGVRLNRAVAVAVAGTRASVFALETLDRLAVLDVPDNAAVRLVMRDGRGKACLCF